MKEMLLLKPQQSLKYSPTDPKNGVVSPTNGSNNNINETMLFDQTQDSFIKQVKFKISNNAANHGMNSLKILCKENELTKSLISKSPTIFQNYLLQSLIFYTMT